MRVACDGMMMAVELGYPEGRDGTCIRGCAGDGDGDLDGLILV